MAGDINGAMSEYPRPLSRLKIGLKDGKLHMTRCLHCKRPKCIEVCEARAITKSDDGVVTIDEERCKGALNVLMRALLGRYRCAANRKR